MEAIEKTKVFLPKTERIVELKAVKMQEMLPILCFLESKTETQNVSLPCTPLHPKTGSQFFTEPAYRLGDSGPKGICKQTFSLYIFHSQFSHH